MKFRVKGNLQITISIDKEIEAANEDIAYAEVMQAFDPVSSDVAISSETQPTIRIQTRTVVTDMVKPT